MSMVERPTSSGASNGGTDLAERRLAERRAPESDVPAVIQRVGVVGCGLMGSGIAEVCARAGLNVVIVEAGQEALAAGRRRVEASLAKAVDRGKLAPEARADALELMTFSTRMADLDDRELVVEAVIERFDVKAAVFEQLDAVTGPGTILASNTSSIPIMRLAMMTRRPEEVLGLHFFNPVPLMKLVEVVRTILTDEAVYEQAVEFGKQLGKVPVRADDRSGFIVNRLLVPYLLDAVRALSEGVGSIVDIDNAMKLGCGYPMGPLTLLDFVGLDTTYYIAEIMFTEFREQRFAPPPLLKRMVLAGLYGRKSGRGFYDYSDPKNPQPMNLV
jgi:3-hydroxybutyryl-CoA dehydrogenase